MAKLLRVCVVTGSRADYGLLLPVLRALKAESGFELQLVVTGMHLAPEFGSTWQQITEDGFAIDARVDMLVAGDSLQSNSKSVGLGVIGFTDAYQQLQPDLVMLLGDRFEIFAAAQAALFARIPIAHIAGGDTTEGAFDEAIRHSITKMAHLHFVTNPQAAQRVMQMGENPEYVHCVGSPALDLLQTLPLLSREEIEQAIGFKLRQRNLLVTYHPVTLAEDSGLSDMQALFAALEAQGEDVGIIFTKSNADAGGRTIGALIDEFAAAHANVVAHTSLGQLRYYSLMAQVDTVMGNSSSGLYEAPSFNVPTVNIGDRQKGRLRAESVIDCGAETGAINAAIERALAMDCSGVSNPYGDGNTTAQIIAVLRDLDDPECLLEKHFFDQD